MTPSAQAATRRKHEPQEGRLRAPLTACAIALSLASCAYVGEPLPPALKIPAPIADVTAVQRGAKIYVNYTSPALSTEGVAITPAEESVRIGESPASPDQPASKEIDIAPWIGKEIAIGVQTRGPSGRWSPMSNVVTLRVRPMVAAPSGLRAESREDGLSLAWAGTAKSYRVFRDGEPVGVAATPAFLDTAAELDKPARYSVQALDGLAESEMSPELTATRLDTFAPPTPSNFAAIAGTNSIELSWDRSPAADFAFFRVYRDGALLADKLTTPSHSDRTAQPGATYRYALSAVDAKGNESARAAAEMGLLR